MDKLKAFINQKKVNAKFKVAGRGHALNEEPAAAAAVSRQPPKARPAASGPTSSAAAAAALARVQAKPTDAERAKARTSAAIKAQAARRLQEEAEAASTDVGIGRRASAEPEEEKVVVVPTQLANLPLLFTCELMPEAPPMPREELTPAIGAFLEAQRSEEPVVAAALMLHSLNKAPAKTTAVETLCKYIDNIRGDPTEEKYRRIRLGNKAIQERVLSVRGGRELLEGVGFKEELSAASAGAEPEPFLILHDVNSEMLQQAKEMLEGAAGVEIRLWRDRRVLGPSAAAAEQLILPDSFFHLSKEQIREEQERKSAEVGQILSLRTQEMRQRDAAKGACRYKYCVMRVGFPGSLTLQGTFRAADNVADLLDFVKEALHNDWALFRLKTPGRVFSSGDEGKETLEEAGLCPASTLRFEWDADMLTEWHKAGVEVTYLSPELTPTLDN